jgi:hypothetical protein
MLCLLSIPLPLTLAQSDDQMQDMTATSAPDPTRDPDNVTAGTPVYLNAPADSPLAYGIVTVLALLLMGAMVFGAYVSGLLAKLVPPETAASIFQSGFRYGLQVALNQAGQTKSPLDDEFFQEMAQQRGLQVIRAQNSDGTFSYAVVQPGAAG